MASTREKVESFCEKQETICKNEAHPCWGVIFINPGLNDNANKPKCLCSMPTSVYFYVERESDI